LALRAPVGTTLEIPNANDQSRLWLTAKTGQIEVYAITLPGSIPDLPRQGIVATFIIFFFSNSRHLDIDSNRYRKRRGTDSQHMTQDGSKKSTTKSEIRNRLATLDYLTDIF